jgi:hypothetical protein
MKPLDRAYERSQEEAQNKCESDRDENLPAEIEQSDRDADRNDK